jgi:hypothetical protein
VAFRKNSFCNVTNVSSLSHTVSLRIFFTHSPCVCPGAQAKKSVADKITHPHAALSQADCMRMVKQLQDQLDEVCSMCSA